MRKVLEQDNICDSLKGRIQYFATRYRGAHDQTGRVAIRLDGKEIFNSDYFDWAIKHHEAWEKIKASTEEISYERAHLSALNQGGFDQHEFYRAFHSYNNSSIDESLRSSDPVVRLFAIMDKRVGKRRLHKLLPEIELQPVWLQSFFRLRLEAERIAYI